MSAQQPPPYPSYIANWCLGQKLGAGFSGAIFVARHVHTAKVVALKIQAGGTGMPTLWAAGQEGYWDYLAIDLLGQSLDSIHRQLIRTQDVWDLRSVCCIAVQVIDRLRFMHMRGILHRDIQLGNCVLGPEGNRKTIYMIDFGFSKFYIDSRTRRHIPDSTEPRDFIGNYWFSSVRVHCRGRVPSRRDDMEALALMLIHILTPGGLSWTRNGVPKTDEDHDKLIYEKRVARPEDLCRGLPSVFEEFLCYCRKVKFDQRPDYERWLDEFYDLADEYGYKDIDEFIWPSPHPEPTVRVTTAPKPTARGDSSGDMEGVLHGIANMQLGGAGERQVLGERQTFVNRDSPKPSKEEGKGKGKGAAAQPHKHKTQSPPEVIELLSSDDENAHARNPPPAVMGRLTKAARLSQLAREVSAVPDTRALGKLVREFVQVMQDNKSKMLTKEGFAVLDALNQQLGDPRTLAAPLRTTRARNGGSQGASQESAGTGSAGETRQGKMNKLWRLGLEVRTARSNEELAKMVAEFGAVINKSSGRTVTKDGIGFLNGLATRIETLS